MGRFLGGIGTTLLFSVFETWMVADFHRLQLSEAGVELSSFLGTMTTLNSIVAVVAGMVSQLLVFYTDTTRAPFMAAIICLVVAFQAILRSWVSWT